MGRKCWVDPDKARARAAQKAHWETAGTDYDAVVTAGRKAERKAMRRNRRNGWC